MCMCVCVVYGSVSLTLTALGCLSAARGHMSALYLSRPLKERKPSEKVTSGWKKLVL